MSAASILLKGFNKHFFQFIDDMIFYFPENEDINISRSYFETIKQANPTLLVKIWHHNIYLPYNSEIEAGNLSFFFEKDYSQDVKQMPNSDQILKVIDTSLREPLKIMDDANMEKCKEHFKLVTRLSAKYMEEKGHM
jgi:hypothetical protein